MPKETLPTRSYVLRQLKRLVCGRTNDCLRLILEESPDVEKLDLRLIEEVKRPKGGGMEIKLLSRLKALELMASICAKEGAEEHTMLLSLLSEEEQG